MGNNFKFINKKVMKVTIITVTSFVIVGCSSASSHNYFDIEPLEVDGVEYYGHTNHLLGRGNVSMQEGTSPEYNDGYFEDDIAYNEALLPQYETPENTAHDLRPTPIGTTLTSEYGELDAHVIGEFVYYVDKLEAYFRTFYFTSHGFSFSFPADYTVAFNSGSYRGNYVWVFDVESLLHVLNYGSGIIMWLGNILTHAPDFEPDRSPERLEGRTELVTEQGYSGHYSIFVTEGGAVSFQFTLYNFGDYFIFIANFSYEHLEFFEPILIYMASSIRIL